MSERKNFSSGLELKAGREGAFRARIATLNVVDHDGDVTLPGAFPVGKAVVISAYGHGSWTGPLPVGKGVIGADNTKAWVDGQFFLDTLGGRDTYSTVKNLGELQQWSYGYEVKFSSVDPTELSAYPGARRILKRLAVLEVSPVLVGAGIDTATESIKGHDSAAVDPEVVRIRDEFMQKFAKAELAEIKRISDLREMQIVCEELGRWVEGLDHVELAEVDADFIEPRTKEVATETLRQACADLEIELPKLRWFAREGLSGWTHRKQYGVRLRGSARLIGQTLQGEIWLRSDLAGEALVTAVAHEARHCAGGDESEATIYHTFFRRNS